MRRLSPKEVRCKENMVLVVEVVVVGDVTSGGPG